jgi:hypothetical protein
MVKSKKEMTQKIQGQPMCCVIVPPRMGPIAAPRKGANVTIDKEMPRWLGRKRSAVVAAAI